MILKLLVRINLLNVYLKEMPRHAVVKKGWFDLKKNNLYHHSTPLRWHEKKTTENIFCKSNIKKKNSKDHKLFGQIKYCYNVQQYSLNETCLRLKILIRVKKKNKTTVFREIVKTNLSCLRDKDI